MHEIYFYVQMKNKKRVWRSPSSKALQLTSIALYTFSLWRVTKYSNYFIGHWDHDLLFPYARDDIQHFDCFVGEHFQNVPYL